jgi:predicted phosphohydrolase
MWSKISPANEREIEQGVSDYSCILNNGRKLRVKESNHLHRQSMKFLEETLVKQVSKTVVVTHHLPSDLCNAPEHRNSMVNEAFCTDYTDVISETKAKFWIYGHSHFNQKPLYLGKTILLTNQLGYIKQNEHAGYRSNAYFVI